MRIADASSNEGVESARRGARNPATSDAAPSSRARSRGGESRLTASQSGTSLTGLSQTAGTRSGRGRVRRGVAETPVLVPPIKVTRVAEDPRVKGRVRVRCQANGETVTLVIGSSGVRAFNIRSGMTLDTVSWAAICREARVVHAQDSALRMLSTCRRSRRDLELRLRRRELDLSVIGDALGRLDSIGLLNDDEFALAEAAAQLRNASRSSGAVKRRLRQRGITGDVADAAVAMAVDSEGVNDVERCEAAAEKRVRQLRSYDRATAQRRLVGFLVRRGFAPDIVFATTRRMLVGWQQSADGGPESGDGRSEDDGDDPDT
jgi:regulatory protein